MRRFLVGAVGLSAACVVIAAPLSAQQPGPPSNVSYSSDSTQVISPTVLATWATERAADGVEQLQFLVLWRGTPGWFLNGGGTQSSQSSGGASTVTITRGEVQLYLEYNSLTRIAVFKGTRIDTHETNVLLVDHVDAPGGPQLVGTLHVASAMPGSARQIGLVLRTSPPIMTFLQCDATSSDPSKQRPIENLCLQTVGVAR